MDKPTIRTKTELLPFFPGTPVLATCLLSCRSGGTFQRCNNVPKEHNLLEKQHKNTVNTKVTVEI